MRVELTTEELKAIKEALLTDILNGIPQGESDPILTGFEKINEALNLSEDL
jgi:hypothetical protein